MHELDTSKSRIRLFYLRNVFVSDNVNNILPEFLTLLQGAIDCPELPRKSYLARPLEMTHMFQKYKPHC